MELIKYIQMDYNMKQCYLIFQFEFVAFRKCIFIINLSFRKKKTSLFNLTL